MWEIRLHSQLQICIFYYYNKARGPTPKPGQKLSKARKLEKPENGRPEKTLHRTHNFSRPSVDCFGSNLMDFLLTPRPGHKYKFSAKLVHIWPRKGLSVWHNFWRQNRKAHIKRTRSEKKRGRAYRTAPYFREGSEYRFCPFRLVRKTKSVRSSFDLLSKLVNGSRATVSFTGWVALLFSINIFVQ